MTGRGDGRGRRTASRDELAQRPSTKGGESLLDLLCRGLTQQPFFELNGVLAFLVVSSFFEQTLLGVIQHLPLLRDRLGQVSETDHSMHLAMRTLGLLDTRCLVKADAVDFGT